MATAATGPIQTRVFFQQFQHFFSIFSARFQQLLKTRRRQILNLKVKRKKDIL
jgi:hypothetical protein